MQKTIDWSGMKFVIAEEMGDLMDVVYVRHLADEDSCQYFLVNHKYYDGVGGFTKVLEDHAGFTYQQMPGLKAFTIPGFWQRLKYLRSFIKLTKKIDLRWKIKRLDKTGAPEGFVTCFLSEEEMTYVQKVVKEKKGSLNSTVFWALDKVISEELLEAGSERKWINPMNMRGTFPVQNPYGNIAASIILNLHGETDPQKLVRMIRQYFKDRLFVGSWLYTNMAKFIGLWGTRKIARKIKDLGVGVYSNMGPWPAPTYTQSEEQSPLKDNWAGVPPSSQILPVVMGVIEWRGQLALTLQMHPSLQLNLQQTQELMKKVIRLISADAQQELGSVKIHRYQDINKFAVRIA